LIKEPQGLASDAQASRNFPDALVARPTLGAFIGHQVAQRGDAPALVFEGRTTSFREFDLQSNRVANALRESGLKEGDRVAYLGKNSDRYFEILFGAAKLGVVLAPINWRLARPELEYLLKDSWAKLIFVDPEFEATVAALTPELPHLVMVVPMERSGNGASYQAWRDRAVATAPQAAVTPESVALQIYTSGTTGRPKGAMLTHRSVLTPRLAPRGETDSWDRWSAGDTSLVAMPNFHIAGSGWGIVGLVHGAKTIIAREFDPRDVLDYIERDRITKVLMVPAALQIVVRQPRAREVDYSCLRYVLYGASPMPLELLKECMAVFGCGFVQLYGMTETSGTIVALPPEDHTPEGSQRMRSAGKPLPGVEIVILDAEGRSLPTGAVGEIAIRSPGNMAGYWSLPDATAKTLDARGWLRTGDAGYLDADGYVYIHDRVKEMIISGGENVYPAEVENAIFGCPGVSDVAVIGIPDQKWGEAVMAVVVPEPGASLTAEGVIGWARERIAGYKVPKSVVFAEDLPRNASGKLLRRELRAPYWADKDRFVN
jgi:long-chain acyl-CoA synthetase